MAAWGHVQPIGRLRCGSPAALDVVGVCFSRIGTLRTPSCMDAPVRARCFRTAWSCDRVLSCIRPSVAPVTDCGPVWRCADQAHITDASCELFGCYCISWSGSDRSIALTVRRPPHTPDVPLAVVPISRSGCNSHRNPIIFAFRQHGPNRAGHLIGNCDRHQHARLAREHAM